jgi:hypothetical protein
MAPSRTGIASQGAASPLSSTTHGRRTFRSVSAANALRLGIVEARGCSQRKLAGDKNESDEPPGALCLPCRCGCAELRSKVQHKSRSCATEHLVNVAAATAAAAAAAAARDVVLPVRNCDFCIRDAVECEAEGRRRVGGG